MTIKQTYEQTIEQRLTDLNAQIKQLAAKADGAQADVKEKYQAEIRSLRKQRNETEARLHELERSGDEAFEDLKRGLDQAVSNLGNAIDSAAARFDDGSDN